MSRADTRGIKIMNLEIMLINSNEKNLFLKWYDMEAWVLMSVLDVIYQRFLYMLLLQIEYCSWFMIRSDVYIVFYFELADDIYSVLVFVLTPTCVFLSLLFVEYNKRTAVFNSTATLVSLHYTGFSGWANASSLDSIFFFMPWCFEVPAWTSFLFISAF